MPVIHLVPDNPVPYIGVLGNLAGLRRDWVRVGGAIGSQVELCHNYDFGMFNNNV